jgi:4-hydroxy-tetrahydrodipicolinate synthase
MELLYTAVTTPFVNNKVDILTLYDHIKFLIRNNSGIVLFGTTGECPTLCDTEKYQIMDYLADNLSPQEKALFVIGVGGNNTQDCIDFSLEATNRGFTKIMITAPYYNKPTQEGLFLHFTTIALNHLEVCSESQVILYNVPGRSVVNINPPTVQRIFNTCTNIVAIKEASGNLNQVIAIRTLVPNIKVYSGDDALTIPIMSVGGIGVISVVSNIFPSQIHSIVQLCSELHYTEAFNKYSKMHNFIEAMFCETNPVPIKYALFLQDMYKSDECRLPLAQLSLENQNKVIKCLNEIKSHFFTVELPF